MPLQWIHSDTRPLHDVAVEAFAAAHAETWPTGPEGNRLFRAWLVSILGTMANLGPTPVTLAPSSSEGKTAHLVTVAKSTRPENLDWQNSIATGVIGLIARRQFTSSQISLPEDQIFRVTTIDGSPATFGFVDQVRAPTSVASSSSSTDALLGLLGTLAAAGDDDTGQGIGILEGIVIVAVVGIVAGASAWINAQDDEVKALELQSKGKQTQAADALTRASELVEKHQQRERDAGKDIPYDAGELSQLQSLRDVVKDTTNWTPPAMTSIPNVKAFSENVGAGLSIGTLILLGLLGYGLMQREARHA